MILDEILAHKHEELERAYQRVAPELLEKKAQGCTDPTRGFRAALKSGEHPVVIAELKRRSPSKGEIRRGFDAVEAAKAYAAAGAAAISVLTDERFFGGQLEFLGQVREVVSLPLLRKDFIVSTYQIDEARVAGADAVLLITAALTPKKLMALREHAIRLGLDVLVEVHDEAELDRAIDCGADLIGINNRNLRTFVTSLEVSERLAPLIPEGVVVVAESGIFTPDDVARMSSAGAHAYLVGESLMRQADLGEALRKLRRIS